MFLENVTVLYLFDFLFKYSSLLPFPFVPAAAKGGSSLVSLITPVDSDFILDLLVIIILSEDLNK